MKDDIITLEKEPVLQDGSRVESAKRRYRNSLEVPGDLVESLVRGEDVAFDRLYVHFVEPLLDFVNAMVHNEEDAKEIVHDTFTYILEKKDRIDFSRNIRGLLYTCARNFTMDYFRKRKTVERYKSMPIRDLGKEIPFDNHVIARETELLVRMAVDSMPEQRRRIFIMNREDKSIREIAGELNISVSAVKQHLVLAKKDLRKLLLAITFFLILD